MDITFPRGAWERENKEKRKVIMKKNGIKGEPALILLIEDNQDHAELAIRNLEESRVANKVVHLATGEAALDYLFHRGDYVDASMSPRPHLILLDLRLPKIDGL